MVELVMPMEVTVEGIPASVNNRNHVYHAKRHSIWAEFDVSIRSRPAGMQDPKVGPVAVRVMYFHDSRDKKPKDVDNILKPILDAIDGTDGGVAGRKQPHCITDDKNVHEVTSRRTDLGFLTRLNAYQFNATQLAALVRAAKVGAALYIRVEDAPNHYRGI